MLFTLSPQEKKKKGKGESSAGAEEGGWGVGGESSTGPVKFHHQNIASKDIYCLYDGICTPYSSGSSEYSIKHVRSFREG